MIKRSYYWLMLLFRVIKYIRNKSVTEIVLKQPQWKSNNMVMLILSNTYNINEL